MKFLIKISKIMFNKLTRLQMQTILKIINNSMLNKINNNNHYLNNTLNNNNLEESYMITLT